MDKLYTENKLPQIDPYVSKQAGNIIAEKIKRYPSKQNGELLQIHSPLENKYNLIIKRCFDIGFSLVCIICILSWLIPLLAIIIKFDSKGPVFFLQKRNGIGRRIFTCIKFRSMVMNNDADHLIEQLNDHRITKTGRFLRRNHLDELPQLFNVLLGSMSVIGPRPYMLSENKMHEEFFTEYPYRYMVKPGITGFAQSLGNYGATINQQQLKQRMKLDILYIQEWSLWIDVKILLRTYRNMVRMMGSRMTRINAAGAAFSSENKLYSK